MKKNVVIFAAIALAISSSAFAWNFGPQVEGQASAGSSAVTGSASASAVVGSGFAKQQTNTWANNTSSAGSQALKGQNSVEGQTYGTTEGSSGANSFGVRWGQSFGATGGFGVQGGFGQGTFEGNY